LGRPGAQPSARGHARPALEWPCPGLTDRALPDASRPERAHNERAGRQPAPADSTVPAWRRRLARLRRSTDWIRRPQVVGRWYRGFSYVWHLLVWSRISAGRRGALPIELPERMLRQKGILLPPPHLDAAGHPDARAVSDGFAEVYALLFANLQRPDLLSSTRHAIPGPAFRGVYLWDSAFIAQIWAAWDTAVAADVLRAVVELRDGDRLQHVVTEFHESPYTQPPLIAWSLARLAEQLHDDAAEALIRPLYRPLCDYQRWLEAHRRFASGLYFWAHPYESGVENAPRFSNTDESVLRNTTTLSAVDLSSYVVLQLEALAASPSGSTSAARPAGIAPRPSACASASTRCCGTSVMVCTTTATAPAARCASPPSPRCCRSGPACRMPSARRGSSRTSSRRRASAR
jgi:hypothetical protein